MHKFKIWSTFIVALAVFGLNGCNSGGPEAKVETARVDSAKNMRDFFDKAHGDYNALSAADKTEFMKLAGDEQKAQQMWNAMKYGPGGFSRPTQPGQ